MSQVKPEDEIPVMNQSQGQMMMQPQGQMMMQPQGQMMMQPNGQQMMMQPQQQMMMQPQQQMMMQPQQQMMMQPQGQMMMQPQGQQYMQPQGQMMMQPQGQMMMQPQKPDEHMYLPMNEKLMAVGGVIIKQKFNLLEAVSGCERPNVYYVYPRHKKDKDKKKGAKMFKYKEKSTCYERCLTGNCKPFRMKCHNKQKKDGDEEQCMECKKECRCTYYCCNRAEMHCYYTELEEKEGGETHYLGKCYDPYDCYNFTFKIYTQNDDCDYVVQATCCQWYFWLQCPCAKCQLVVFKIHEGSSTSGPLVGELRRQGKDCTKNFVLGEGADEFSCDFPEKSDWRQRAMLMNLVVFIDYTMFEESSDSTQKR